MAIYSTSSKILWDNGLTDRELAVMSPGTRVRQNARVQDRDDPVNHDESAKTQNEKHGQQTGLG